MVCLNNVSVTFDKHRVLQDISLSFTQNGIYCLSAPSGRGKTTLLNVIAGLVPYTGTVKTQGKVAYLFQEDRLLPWLSAYGNIALVSSAERASYYSGLWGIPAFRDRSASLLSGGEKRRVALARCLAYDGDILLLDEPFRGLDEENILAVCAELNKLAQSRILLVVTHDADDVLRLKAQRVTLD